MYVHVVAHARPGLAPLFDFERARWLWDRLRAGFEGAISAILMPNHLHLIDLLRKEARRQLAAILASFSRCFGLGEVWLPVPEPDPLRTRDELVRDVRYVALNCCRPWKWRGRARQLVADPLEWPWSTHRDVVGAVADPWVNAHRLGEALEWRTADVAACMHRYVSSDPSVAVAGTAFPQPAPSSVGPAATLDDIACAALAATRSHPDALRRRTPARRVFIALAYRQGLRNPSLLAALCGVHANAVARIARDCPPEWLDAAALCLGDPRLRAGLPRVHLGRAERLAPRA